MYIYFIDYLLKEKMMKTTVIWGNLYICTYFIDFLLIEEMRL